MVKVGLFWIDGAQTSPRDIRKILFVGGDVVAAAIGRWTVDTTSMYMWDEGRITVRVALVF